MKQIVKEHVLLSSFPDYTQLFEIYVDAFANKLARIGIVGSVLDTFFVILQD